PQVITGGYNDNVTETYLKFLFNVCRTSPDSTHGNKYFEGHQFTNFVLIVNGDIIPLASVPLYSHYHCKELGIRYQSEIEIVTQWIEMLPESELLTADILSKIYVLLDSGYDAKSIQNAIQDAGLNFIASITCGRNVNGLPVKDYFRRNRHIPWRTIQMKTGTGIGNRVRKYRARTAKNVHLKGSGEVTVFCSEKRSRTARKTSRKYIVTSDQHLSTRKAVINYAKRWKIEVWHKTMKQFYGYGDCRCKNFRSVEAHINFSLCAYCINSLCDPNLPVAGTTLDQYQACLDWSKAAKVINLFGGREKIKDLAAAEIQKVMNG
ncbi:transposase, partial [Pseudobacteriovorax antillogorgiicola]